LENFEAPPQATGWPEAGSRAMQLLVVAGFQVMGPDWVVVQPERYRYLVSTNSFVLVRIAVSEY
jgi:hypothetical protein